MTVFQFEVPRILIRFCPGQKSEHQRLRKRSGLRSEIANVLHFDTGAAELSGISKIRSYRSASGKLGTYPLDETIGSVIFPWIEFGQDRFNFSDCAEPLFQPHPEDKSFV